MHDGGIERAGDDHRARELALGDAADELHAVHPGHVEVADDDVRRPRARRAAPVRPRRPPASVTSPTPEPAEQLQRGAALEVVVLDDEHGAHLQAVGPRDGVAARQCREPARAPWPGGTPPPSPPTALRRAPPRALSLQCSYARTAPARSPASPSTRIRSWCVGLLERLGLDEPLRRVGRRARGPPPRPAPALPARAPRACIVSSSARTPSTHSHSWLGRNGSRASAAARPACSAAAAGAAPPAAARARQRAPLAPRRGRRPPGPAAAADSRRVRPRVPPPAPVRRPRGTGARRSPRRAAPPPRCPGSTSGHSASASSSRLTVRWCSAAR